MNIFTVLLIIDAVIMLAWFLTTRNPKNADESTGQAVAFFICLFLCVVADVIGLLIRGGILLEHYFRH